jgi:membrane associated rhomboid family serine protease
MEAVLHFLNSLFTQKPYVLIAWPIAAMLIGTVLRPLLGKRANRLAIVPRTFAGLLGIATAPFIHGNFAHLAANVPPFAVLGALLLRHGEHAFVTTALLIAASSGLLLWLFGRQAAHIGMSGVIFGFFGYLVAVAYLTRSVGNVLIAAAVLVLYGSMLAGIKPARNGTSWEGHLFGLVAGIATAWFLRG